MDKVGILSPSSVTTNPVPFQTYEFEKGGFSGDGQVFWIWSRDYGLSVYRRQPEFRKLGWINTEDQSLIDSCEASYKRTKLFVLLFEYQGQSTVAVLSQFSGELVQAITISSPANCICDISDAALPGLFNTTALQHFNGAVCLGSENGCAFVLDLGLGNLSDQPRSSMCAPRGCKRIHINTPSIQTHMNSASGNNKQLGLDLNSQYIKGKFFHYTDSADRLLFSIEKASITSLLHVRQICCVLIGYSFGGFQIFSFYDNNILFTFPFSVKHQYPSVTHFAFQEPENDPKPYVYMWVARKGLPPQGKLKSPPTMTLFQLAFQSRVRDQDIAYYQDMEGCIQRFELVLWPDPYSSAKLLTCTTIERMVPAKNFESSFSKAFSKALSVDRTLAVFTCQLDEQEDDDDSDEGCGLQGLVTVFDLNQWYHSQMPVFPKWTSVEGQRKSCSFLSLYRLADESVPLMDIAVTSLRSFNSPQPVPESHLWPESLTIDVSTLSESGVSACIYEGVQQLTLSQMISLGADMLLDVERLVSMCSSAQLIESKSDNPVYDLLTVLLNYQLKVVLMAIAKRVQNLGSSLNTESLFFWIKSKVDELVTEKSKILESIVTSTGTVDQYLLTRVHESHRQLCLLMDIIAEVYLAQSSHLSEDEVYNVYNPACVYSEIYRTTCWCLENSLIPFSLDTDGSPMCEDTFIFPLAALHEKYTLLRKRRMQLAVDVLIEEISSDDQPFKYPPEGIDCLLYTKVYPPSATRYCLDLYMLFDISSGKQALCQNYCDFFSIPVYVKKLALSVWSVDHDTLNASDAKLLSMHYPSIYEIGVRLLLYNDKHSDVILCLELGVVPCLDLHLQALIESGHVQKAFMLLSQFESSQEYQFFLEKFVTSCLKSPFAHQLKQIQMNQGQLTHFCRLLRSHGQVDLSLALLLQHHCNTEAITLAKEPTYQSGVLGKCLSQNTALLPPVKNSMCSDELLKRVQATLELPIGPPESLSCVMPKAKEQQFTSQVDVILAVSQKVAEARQKMVDPVTPLHRTRNRLEDTGISFSPRLSTVPFTSSPLPAARNLKPFKQAPVTPLIASSSVKRVPTPQPFNVRTKTTDEFVARMELFREKMSKMNELEKRPRQEFVLQTPRPIVIEGTPHTDTKGSILKRITSLKLPDSSSKSTSSTNKRIRFEDDSFMAQSTPAAAKIPLPDSDDSDDFLSPEVSFDDRDKPKHTKDEESSDRSFIASAEEEEEEQKMPVDANKQRATKTSVKPRKKTTDPTSKLTRESLKQQKQSNVSVLISPLPITSTGQGFSSGTRRTRYSNLKSSQPSTKDYKKHSGVMVNLKMEEELKYKFSPPKTVSMVTPSTTTTTANPATTSSLATVNKSSQFVFSPPLLRSAKQEKKEAEFKRFGVEDKSILEMETPSSTQSTTTSLLSKGRQEKRVRQVKAAQATPRRSERLLRSSKKF